MIFEILTNNFKVYKTGKFGMTGIERKVATDESLRPDFSKYENISPFLIDLAKSGWSHSSGKRPSFKEILSTIQKELSSKRNVKITLKDEEGKAKQANLKEPTIVCLRFLFERKFPNKFLEKITDKEGRIVEEDNIFILAKEGITFQHYHNSAQKKTQDLVFELEKMKKLLEEKEKEIQEKDLKIKEFLKLEKNK